MLVALAAAALLATSPASAVKRCHPSRQHRCHKRPRPPKPAPHLPRRLEVDENDQGQPPQPYSLRPSHNPVGAGKVEFNVYNYGQDPHTFAVIDARGRQLAFAAAPPDQPDSPVTVSAALPAGRYTLECTLPGHAALGMRATLTVR